MGLNFSGNGYKSNSEGSGKEDLNEPSLTPGFMVIQLRKLEASSLRIDVKTNERYNERGEFMDTNTTPLG